MKPLPEHFSSTLLPRCLLKVLNSSQVCLYDFFTQNVLHKRVQNIQILIINLEPNQWLSINKCPIRTRISLPPLRPLNTNNKGIIKQPPRPTLSASTCHDKSPLTYYLSACVCVQSVTPLRAWTRSVHNKHNNLMSRVTSSGTYGVRTPTCTRPCSAGQYHFFRDCCCCCRANLDPKDSSHQFRVCARGKDQDQGWPVRAVHAHFAIMIIMIPMVLFASDGSRGCVAYKFHRLMFNSCPWRLQRVQRQTGTARRWALRASRQNKLSVW